MDPAGIKLEPSDTSAPEFPVPHAFGPIPELLEAIGIDPYGENVEGDPDSNEWIVGDWFAPKPSRPLHSTRCAATVKATGKRCRRWAVIGFTKCEKHSGYDKFANLKEYRERVLERARLDLLRTAPYAVEAINEMVRDREINPAVRLKAAETALDRVGVKGGTEIEVTVNTEGMSAADTIRARLDRLAALDAAASPTAAGESEIMDAEVLDDDDAEG